MDLEMKRADSSRRFVAPIVFHISCGFGRELRPQQTTHHMQRQIDSGANAGRQNDFSVVDDPPVFMHRRLGRYFSQQRNGTVMRCRRQSNKQPCFAQQQRSGANRDQQFYLLCLFGNPIEQAGVVNLFPRALPAGNDQDVRRRTIRNLERRIHTQAIDRAERRRGFGNRVNVKRRWTLLRAGHRENFQRPAEVENFDVFEQKNCHISRGRGRTHESKQTGQIAERKSIDF